MLAVMQETPPTVAGVVNPAMSAVRMSIPPDFMTMFIQGISPELTTIFAGNDIRRGCEGLLRSLLL